MSLSSRSLAELLRAERFGSSEFRQSPKNLPEQSRSSSEFRQSSASAPERSSASTAFRRSVRWLLIAFVMVSLVPANFAQSAKDGPGDEPPTPSKGEPTPAPKPAPSKGAPTSTSTGTSKSPALPGTPSDLREVTFSAPTYSVGLSRNQDTHLEMNLEVSMFRPGMGSRSLNMHSLRREKMTEKALDVDEKGKVTRVELRVTRADEVESHNGKESSKTFPMSGKTYIVHRAAEGILRVRYPDGGTPAPAEVRGALKEARLLQNNDTLSQSLVGRTVRVGESAPYLEKGVMAAFARGKKTDKMKVERLTTKVEAVRTCGTGACALFSIQMDVSMGRGPAAMLMELRGKLLVKAEGTWPLHLELKGPLSLKNGNSQDTGDDKPRISGGGNITIRFRNQFE